MKKAPLILNMDTRMAPGSPALCAASNRTATKSMKNIREAQKDPLSSDGNCFNT